MTAGIRPFVAEDVAQVADLYELVMRSRVRRAPPALPDYFRRIFLDHPWADPEIPSLVHEDRSGRIVGFVGSHARRMTFDGRPIRVGVCSQLIADPEARSQAVGSFLMRRYMTGVQDLSVMETCSDGMRFMWESLGGHTVHLNCLNYTRFFRPARFLVNQRLSRPGPLRRVLHGVADVADRPITRYLKPLNFGDRGRGADDLTPEAFLHHLPTVAGRRRLLPRYDLAFLRWQWFEMAQVRSKGELHGSLVRDANGEVVGWYLYQVVSGDKGHIITVDARRGSETEALAQLFSDARAREATLVHGRMEFNLHVPIVAERRSWLHSRFDRTLIHARDGEILRAYALGDAMFTRMEGEFWMGFHLEPFQDPVVNPHERVPSDPPGVASMRG